jgi:hypothetical protein
MKAKDSDIIIHNRNVAYIALATLVVLLVPMVAMQFTDEVNWTISDFIVAGLLLFGTGLAYELSTRNVKNIWKRIAIGAALFLALIFIWAELSVGVFSKFIN